MFIEAISPVMPVAPVSRIDNTILDPTYRFFHALLELERMAGGVLDFQMQELDEIQARFKELSAERLKISSEAIDQKQAAANWSFLHKAWTTVISAVSTVLGLSVMATPGGTFVGAAMVASGSMSIANLAATESGAWNSIAKHLAGNNRDLQEKIARWIPTTIDVSSSVIGLLGASNAVLEQTLGLSTEAVSMAKTAGFLGKEVASVAKGSYEAQARNIQATLLELTKKTDVNQHDLDAVTQSIKTLSEQLGQTQAQAAQLVKQAIKKV